MTTLVSLTAYADSHGVKKQSASEWKTRGYLAMVGDLIDQEACDQKLKNAGKGRFRTKAHGGRRQAGVRGVVDRPGLPAQHAPAKPQTSPWLTWHRPGNPHTLHSTLREAVEDGDQPRIDELLDTFAHDEWECERILVGCIVGLGWLRRRSPPP